MRDIRVMLALLLLAGLLAGCTPQADQGSPPLLSDRLAQLGQFLDHAWRWVSDLPQAWPDIEHTLQDLQGQLQSLVNNLQRLSRSLQDVSSSLDALSRDLQALGESINRLLVRLGLQPDQ